MVENGKVTMLHSCPRLKGGIKVQAGGDRGSWRLPGTFLRVFRCYTDYRVEELFWGLDFPAYHVQLVGHDHPRGNQHYVQRALPA